MPAAWLRVAALSGALLELASTSASHACSNDDGCKQRSADAGLILLQQSDRVSRASMALSATDCGSCDTCVAQPKDQHGQDVTDEACKPCARDKQSWWPCTVQGLCQCADNELAPAPPTPIAPMPKPTQAPTPQPSPAPEVVSTIAPSSPATSTEGCMGCSTCVANPGNSAGQHVTDAQCSPCAFGAQSWWPCNMADLCKCAEDSSAGPTPTEEPTPAPTTVPSPAPSPTQASPSPAAVVPSPSFTCTETLPEGGCDFVAGEGISSWFTEDLFNEMFPNICNAACHGCDMLTYKCLIKATLMYPDFAQSGSEADNKRELAAWLGEMSQETTGGGCGASIENSDGTCSCGSMWCDGQAGGGCAAWGLCFVEEAGGTYCADNAVYPCVPGKKYKGRGPKQLSWNYNYGQFSQKFCGNKSTLLNNPTWVATNPTLAWASSIWFWFSGGACLPETGEVCKPSCHDVFLGKRKMCAADLAAGRRYGLGWVTNIINGGLECGGRGNGKCDYRVHSRVRFYKHFCNILGVDPLAEGWSEDENLFCHDQKDYTASPPTQC